MNPLKSWLSNGWVTLLGAIAFYTVLPIPHHWPLNFHGIARWVVVVGLLIGAGLSGLDAGLAALGMSSLLRSGLVAIAWVGITGGLHLDGAMDTADGLAVPDPQRRLQVMADSRSGAFGVMAAIALLLLKTLALADLSSDRGLVLMLVAGWGRWGQLVAIARYPYLKREGKGALHKQAIHSLWEAVPSLILMLGLSGIFGAITTWTLGMGVGLSGLAIALLTGAYFNHKLGGQTGDTYGAIVEWTEALLLCVLPLLIQIPSF
jgi:adenosylcobinamide-GDP ribazoletransferase